MIRYPLSPPRVAAALDAARLTFGVEPRVILSLRRDPPTALARFAVWLALSEGCGAGVLHLGRRFERDHTTVVHGLQRARRFVAEDAEYAAAVALITAEVRAV